MLTSEGEICNIHKVNRINRGESKILITPSDIKVTQREHRTYLQVSPVGGKTVHVDGGGYEHRLKTFINRRTQFKTGFKTKSRRGNK